MANNSIALNTSLASGGGGTTLTPEQLAILNNGGMHLTNATFDEPSRKLTITNEQGDVVDLIIPDQYVTLIDDLLSVDATKALTANQGRVLKELIDSLTLNKLDRVVFTTLASSGMTVGQVSKVATIVLQADEEYHATIDLRSDLDTTANHLMVDVDIVISVEPVIEIRRYLLVENVYNIRVMYDSTTTATETTVDIYIGAPVADLRVLGYVRPFVNTANAIWFSDVALIPAPAGLVMSNYTSNFVPTSIPDGEVLIKRSLTGGMTGSGLTLSDVLPKTTTIRPTPNATDSVVTTEKAVRTELDLKVDKVTGKGLSTNDFSNTYKTELDTLWSDKITWITTNTGGSSSGKYTKIGSLAMGASSSIHLDIDLTLVDKTSADLNVCRFLISGQTLDPVTSMPVILGTVYSVEPVARVNIYTVTTLGATANMDIYVNLGVDNVELRGNVKLIESKGAIVEWLSTQPWVPLPNGAVLASNRDVFVPTSIHDGNILIKDIVQGGVKDSGIPVDTIHPHALTIRNTPNATDTVTPTEKAVRDALDNTSANAVPRVVSSDNSIVRFNGTGGLVQNSVATVSDVGNLATATYQATNPSGKLMTLGDGSFQDKYIEFRSTDTGVQLGLQTTASTSGVGLIKTGTSKEFAVAVHHTGLFSAVTATALNYRIDLKGTHWFKTADNEATIRVGRYPAKASIKSTTPWLIMDGGTTGVGLNWYEAGLVSLAQGGGTVTIGENIDNSILTISSTNVRGYNEVYTANTGGTYSWKPKPQDISISNRIEATVGSTVAVHLNPGVSSFNTQIASATLTAIKGVTYDTDLAVGLRRTNGINEEHTMFKSNGNLGVGVTNPTTKVQVGTTAYIQDATLGLNAKLDPTTNTLVNVANGAVLDARSGLNIYSDVGGTLTNNLRFSTIDGLPDAKAYQMTNTNTRRITNVYDKFLTGTSTGRITIKLPTDVHNSASMMRLDVSYYSYTGGITGASGKISIYGYLYTNGTMINYGVTSNNVYLPFNTVELYDDGTNNYLVLGDVDYNVAHFAINLDIQVHWVGRTRDWAQGWDVTVPSGTPVGTVKTKMPIKNPTTIGLEEHRSRRAEKLLCMETATATLNPNSYLDWTGSFIMIGSGMDAHGGSGYIRFTRPATGTVIPVVGSNGRSTSTVGVSGISLVAWEALYYIIPKAHSSASVSANYRLVGYNKQFQVPANWVLLGHYKAGVNTTYFQLADQKIFLKQTNAVDTEWISLVPLNQWDNYSPNDTPLSFRCVSNVVTIRGMVKNGSTTNAVILAVLPSPYRPKYRHVLTALTRSATTSGTAFRFDVNINGDLQLRGVDNTWVSINVSFSIN